MTGYCLGAGSSQEDEEDAEKGEEEFNQFQMCKALHSPAVSPA